MILVTRKGTDYPLTSTMISSKSALASSGGKFYPELISVLYWFLSLRISPWEHGLRENYSAGWLILNKSFPVFSQTTQMLLSGSECMQLMLIALSELMMESIRNYFRSAD